MYQIVDTGPHTEGDTGKCCPPRDLANAGAAARVDPIRFVEDPSFRATLVTSSEIPAVEGSLAAWYGSGSIPGSASADGRSKTAPGLPSTLTPETYSAGTVSHAGVQRELPERRPSSEGPMTQQGSDEEHKISASKSKATSKPSTLRSLCSARTVGTVATVAALGLTGWLLKNGFRQRD